MLHFHATASCLPLPFRVDVSVFGSMMLWPARGVSQSLLQLCNQVPTSIPCPCRSKDGKNKAKINPESLHFQPRPKRYIPLQQSAPRAAARKMEFRMTVLRAPTSRMQYRGLKEQTTAARLLQIIQRFLIIQDSLSKLAQVLALSAFPTRSYTLNPKPLAPNPKA